MIDPEKTAGKHSLKKLKAKDLAYIAMFAALMSVCSWITIPLTLPITLQTFAVFAAVGFLGLWRGTLSVLVYIFLGAVGLPVFSNFTGGIGVLSGPTGGYITGFIFTALLSGAIMKKWGDRLLIMTTAFVAGLIVCYAFGTAWFMLVYTAKTGAIGLLTALSWCVFPFILPDAVKIAIATALVRTVSKRIKL